MPIANYFKLNLITKIWQCQLKLIPNSGRIVIITLDQDEHMKMNIGIGKEKPPPFTKNPKMWRKYHTKIIKQLFEMDTGVVGFDFMFSMSQDESIMQGTEEFISGLKWAKDNNYPIGYFHRQK